MPFLEEPAAAGAILLGLWLVGITHLRSKLTSYGLQTVVIGLLAVWIGVEQHERALVVVGVVVTLCKGIGLPAYLAWVVRRIGCRRDEGLAIAPPLVLLLTLGALASLITLRPLGDEMAGPALPAMCLLLIGMVLMVSRRLAVSQIVGFLVLENGIFYYTISQPHSMPLVVELGVLLDVMVGAMLAGLLVFRISDSFEHIDVTELRQLNG